MILDPGAYIHTDGDHGAPGYMFVQAWLRGLCDALTPAPARPGLINLPGTDSGGVRGHHHTEKSVWFKRRRHGRGEPSPPPPPRQPLPHGGDSPSIHCPGVHHLIRFPVIDSPKILFPPCTVSGLSPETARPLEGRGRRLAERPGERGDRLQPWKTVFSDTSRQERGSRLRLPLPVSPSPTGAILHRYSPGSGSPFAVSTERSRRSLSCSLARYPDYRQNCPPLEGAGGARRSGRASGVDRPPPWKTVPVTRRDSRGGAVSPPPPCQPLPQGRFPHRFYCPGVHHSSPSSR